VAPRETAQGERRVSLTPDAVRGLVRDGLEVAVEAGAGEAAGYPDAAYEKAGAGVEADRDALVRGADVVAVVQGTPEVFEAVGEGRVLIGLLRPLDGGAHVPRLAERGVTAFAMELIPRITRAQAMDALSSQANLAGYRAVLVAAAALRKALPMMVTAAGTVSPARVLVLGAGVAGLQAIATAKRLGAIVEAYDVRPAVKEQVESLGAKFVELDLEVSEAEDAGGYAREQTEEMQRRQREQLARRVRQADVVVTTALVPGARAPLLVEEPTLHEMRPGSVVLDMASAQGGNVESSRPDEAVQVGGVTVLGPTNLPSEVAFHASQTYARNVASFLGHLIEEGRLALDLEDEITRGALLTHEGEIANERARKAARGGEG